MRCSHRGIKESWSCGNIECSPFLRPYLGFFFSLLLFCFILGLVLKSLPVLVKRLANEHNIGDLMTSGAIGFVSTADVSTGRAYSNPALTTHSGEWRRNIGARKIEAAPEPVKSYTQILDQWESSVRFLSNQRLLTIERS